MRRIYNYIVPGIMIASLIGFSIAAFVLYAVPASIDAPIAALIVACGILLCGYIGEVIAVKSSEYNMAIMITILKYLFFLCAIPFMFINVMAGFFNIFIFLSLFLPFLGEIGSFFSFASLIPTVFLLYGFALAGLILEPLLLWAEKRSVESLIEARRGSIPEVGKEDSFKY